MPIKSLGDLIPQIDSSAWISEAAYIVGDVIIGEGSSVWPGAVVRGDFGSIRIGANAHIEDNCVVHSEGPNQIGNNVIVGHSVVVHGKLVGSNCLIGSNTTLLDRSIIGSNCLVAAGSLLLGDTIVPDGSFVYGSPAQVRPASESQLRMLAQLSGRDVGYAMMSKRYKAAGL
jgi:carbonic anhydrase/acetyltransferase-like protein (isoleucine patch superfamily)